MGKERLIGVKPKNVMVLRIKIAIYLGPFFFLSEFFPVRVALVPFFFFFLRFIEI